MKLWQKLKEKAPSIDWEDMSKSGWCGSISCDDCPTGGNCDKLTDVLNSDVVDVLNSDVVEVLNSDIKEGKQMKEVAEWDGKPREMWVWNANIEDKSKAFVIWIKKTCNTGFKVVTVNKDGNIPTYMHCAEINQTRLMTNKELARWLRERPDREWSLKGGNSSTGISSTLTYSVGDADKSVSDWVIVREGDGEWHKPFVEE